MPRCCAAPAAAARRRSSSALAAAMRADFNRHLMRDGTVAGYAIFDAGRGGAGAAAAPERHAHRPPLFAAADDPQHHRRPVHRRSRRGITSRLIREHLLFPDGVRLMDRPVAYRGGPERVFRRAESAAFFGREIGLMYVHAHLRYGEAMATLGEADALWEALQVVNPIAVTERLANASPRQRNAYFSSSDAAFPDRYRGERRVGARQGGHASPSTAAGASIRAARASTPTCCSATRSASAGASASASSRRSCRGARAGHAGDGSRGRPRAMGSDDGFLTSVR